MCDSDHDQSAFDILSLTSSRNLGSVGFPLDEGILKFALSSDVQSCYLMFERAHVINVLEEVEVRYVVVMGCDGKKRAGVVEAHEVAQ